MFWFQLKSQKSRLGDSITDRAYRALMEAIKEGAAGVEAGMGLAKFLKNG